MTDHNITSPALTSDTVLFFDVPLKFFQTTNEFQLLLADLEKATSIGASETEIKNLERFKEPLAEIREAFRLSRETATLAQQKEQLAVAREAVARDVLKGEVNYRDLSLEEQPHVLDFIVKFSTSRFDEHQAEAAALLVKLQIESTSMVFATQKQLLETQQQLVATTEKNAKATETLVEDQAKATAILQRIEVGLAAESNRSLLAEISLQVQEELLVAGAHLRQNATRLFASQDNEQEILISKGVYGSKLGRKTQTMKIRTLEEIYSSVVTDFVVKRTRELKVERGLIEVPATANAPSISVAPPAINLDDMLDDPDFSVFSPQGNTAMSKQLRILTHKKGAQPFNNYPRRN
jgi:hypothetical protein